MMFTGYASATYTVKDFHTIWPWNYKSDGLYQVDIGINPGTDSANSTLSDGIVILAMGDLDDDKHNDLVSVSDDQMTVTIHYWNNKVMKFSNSKKLDTGDCKVSAAFIIPNPDFRLALLCTEDSEHEYLKMMNKDDNFAATDLSDIKIQKSSQPLFIDINSDTFVDIVYNQNSNSGSYDIRVSLYNTNTKEYDSNTLGFLETYIYENADVGCKSLPNKEALKLSIPNFSTIVDVNADCVSDLYLMADTGSSDENGFMFISTIIKSGGEEYMRYCLVETDDMSGNKYTSPVFADFNNDASIDKLFYKKDNNAIHIYYNERGSNSASATSLCRGMPTVTNNTPAGLFTDYTVFSKEPDVSILSDVNGLYDHSFVPGQLRYGDVDSDGYPDLLVTVKDKNDNPVTVVLVNSACNAAGVTHSIKRELTDEADVCTTRTFDTSNDYDQLSQYENTKYGFLIDLDNNGRQDFVLVTLGSNKTTELLGFYNNFARDSYYITAATYTSGSDAYGSKVYGASYRGVFTTLSDNKQPFVAHQMTRSAFTALESPIGMYVIGRSNNYIEDFTLTYPIQKYDDSGAKTSLSVESFSWTPIIPNSHLLIDINNKFSSGWNIRLLINPTDSFLLVGIILSLILIVIGGVIIYIHMKEKKEDEESRNPQLDFF